MQETFLDKEKIRTMQRDIKEAEGISVYPKSNESDKITQSFIAEKEETPLSTNKPYLEKIEEPTIEPLPTEQTPLSVEEETKKAEDLAYELAISTNESEDNIKQNILAPTTEEMPTAEPAPVAFMNFPKEEPETEEEIEVPEPEPKSETEINQSEIPETLPIEDFASPLDLEVPEKMPSAKDLGLEELEKLPSVEELGLEEPTVKEKEEAKKIVDENEIKLSKIAEQTFELEEALKGINEEKAPFDKRKKEIEDVVDNIKKKLDLIIERKNKIEEIKKGLEEKEAAAQSSEEKRAIEKERWRVEDERDTIEKEKDEKEDEIKSLRLQIRECDLNAEKVIAKEKNNIQQLETLKRDKDKIILSQTKKDLEERLQPLNQNVENIKREMFDNTKKRDKADKNMTDIGLKEKAVEDEIKILERRQNEATDEVILRDIETRRRTAEDNRRKLEKDRWETEDKVKDLEETRKMIKEKYQEVAAQIRQIKDELLGIEEKMK
jgi:hypothetical protein